MYIVLINLAQVNSQDLFQGSRGSMQKAVKSNCMQVQIIHNNYYIDNLDCLMHVDLI